MKKEVPSKVSIFVSVDLQVINTYFNVHDPAPLYKRQLSHQFEQYILKSAATVKRYSVVFYKLKCSKDIDRQYAEPLMYAIRRHFAEQKKIKEDEFYRYKRKSFSLLAVSFLVLIFCHGIIPLLITPTSAFESILLTSVDVFSWVIFWRPLDKLIFEWNPHLKEISLMDKLSAAEMMIVSTSKEAAKKTKPVLFAISQTG
ncbi:MAG: hypothetical protein JO072_03925 [Parafilimonas sp.]|nr:hypothetical protein [Parafilimonas sp.]